MVEGRDRAVKEAPPFVFREEKILYQEGVERSGGTYEKGGTMTGVACAEWRLRRVHRDTAERPSTQESKRNRAINYRIFLSSSSC